MYVPAASAVLCGLVEDVAYHVLQAAHYVHLLITAPPASQAIFSKVQYASYVDPTALTAPLTRSVVNAW